MPPHGMMRRTRFRGAGRRAALRLVGWGLEGILHHPLH